MERPVPAVIRTELDAHRERVARRYRRLRRHAQKGRRPVAILAGHRLARGPQLVGEREDGRVFNFQEALGAAARDDVAQVHEAVLRVEL